MYSAVADLGEGPAEGRGGGGGANIFTPPHPWCGVC